MLAAFLLGSHDMNLIVQQFMTPCPHVIGRDGSLAVAHRLMRDNDIRHLPVLEGENLLGMVGIREVVRVLVERLWRTHDPEARDRARELLARDAT